MTDQLGKTKKWPFAELIQQRRTIRKFKSDPIAINTIKELLNIAVWAPNHHLREPWRFILFVDDGKQLLVDAIVQNALKKKDPERFLAVPAYLAVTMNEVDRQKEREEDMFATAAMLQNFQLAAWERGIGMVWLTEPFTYQPAFRKSIGVRPEEKLIGLLKIGYPEEIPPAKPRTAAEDKLTVVN